MSEWKEEKERKWGKTEYIRQIWETVEVKESGGSELKDGETMGHL